MAIRQHCSPHRDIGVSMSSVLTHLPAQVSNFSNVSAIIPFSYLQASVAFQIIGTSLHLWSLPPSTSDAVNSHHSLLDYRDLGTSCCRGMEQQRSRCLEVDYMELRRDVLVGTFHIHQCRSLRAHPFNLPLVLNISIVGLTTRRSHTTPSGFEKRRRFSTDCHSRVRYDNDHTLILVLY
jgi:hypothetical protein